MRTILTIIYDIFWVFLAVWAITDVVKRWKWFADKTFHLVPGLLLAAAVVDGAVGELFWWKALIYMAWGSVLIFDKRLSS